MHQVITTINLLSCALLCILYLSSFTDIGKKIFVDDTPLEEYVEKNIPNKTNFMKDKFIHITRIFDDRLKSFIKIMLMNGKCEYYTYRIEFQLRGLPHTHGVFWIKKELIEKYIEHKENGIEYSDDITELIDEWVSVSLNTGSPELDKLVAEVNTHKHTKSCLKRGTGCRYKFPRFPSDVTIISKPFDKSDKSEEEIVVYEKELEEAKDVLKLVRDHLDNIPQEIQEKNCLKSFLKHLDVDYDKYHNALKFSEVGKSVILKRKINETYVNNYNPALLLAWKANIDIQFCLDHYAVVTYVSDYFTKDDSGLTQVLQKAVNESKYTNDFDRLNYLKQVFFTHRQVCVCEAAYRLISGLNLKGANIKCIFVQTGFPENRTTFLKRISDEDDEDGDESSEELDGDEEVMYTKSKSTHNTVTMPGREGKFFMTQSVHQKYENRPKLLENMCLAQFSTHYEPLRGQLPKKTIIIDNVSTEVSNQKVFQTEVYLPKYIKLMDEKNTLMKLRTTPAILRLHKKKMSHEQMYSELLLFLPFTNELKDLSVDPTKCMELYEKKKEKINEKRKSIYPFSQDIDLVEMIIDSEGQQKAQDVYDILNTAMIQEDSDDAESLEPIDTSELPDDPKPMSKPKEGCKFKPIIPDEIEEMKLNVRKLSFEQRIVFDKIISFCKDVVMSRKCQDFNPVPPKVIIHGN